MTDVNPFSSLKLDVWYKALIPFGAVLAIIPFVYSPQFITQKELFVLGCGIFLLGLGEWKNQKYYVQFVDASIFNPFMKITTPIRKGDPLGTFLDMIGIIAIIVSLLNFFNVVTWLD